jgi:molybdate transport system ATP-binding protein
MPGSKRKSRRTASREFLALENASVRLGDRIVFRGTNWTWRAGEQWAMLGPDGAGKSLLIQALLGHVPLVEGDLRGPYLTCESAASPITENIAHVSPETQRCVAIQESSFYQSRWHSGAGEGLRTVEQFLSQESVEERNPFEVGVRDGNRREFLRRQSRFVRWLGISGLLSRKLVHLSNGELRKALLVHAVLKAPCLLILEDPFAGLDAATRRVLHRVIARVMRGGMCVLVATSRPEEIPTSASHLLVIDQHQVIAQGPVDHMLRVWRERFRTPAAKLRTLGSRKPKPSPPENSPLEAEPLVEFRNVSVMHGAKQILRDITWTLRRGECWALFGRNGAGKTTLLNLIQGDHPQIYAQSVRLFGQSTDSTQRLWQMRGCMGWMSPELHQHYPGDWETLDVVCSGFFNTVGLYEPCSRSKRNAARHCLMELGLAAHAPEPFGQLSFGQQRLVLLARAAVKRPRLLILDEPCQGLDATQRLTVLAAVDRVVAQTGASLIFVTHHANEVPRCITHLLRLEAGRVRQTARPARSTPRL